MVLGESVHLRVPGMLARNLSALTAMLLPLASCMVGSPWQERQSVSACAGCAGRATSSADAKSVRAKEEKVFIRAPVPGAGAAIGRGSGAVLLPSSHRV